MTKELITIVSTEGKSPEEVSEQTYEATVKYFAVGLGLSKCEVCGEYKGEAHDNKKTIKVDCVCNGILCTLCKKTKIHRPISNLFSHTSRQILHVPYFHHICSKCMNRTQNT